MQNTYSGEDKLKIMKGTLKEFLTNFLGTTIPLLLVSIFALFSPNQLEELRKPLIRGELFLYSTSFWVYIGFMLNEKLQEKNFVDSITGALYWFPIVVGGGCYLIIYLVPTISFQIILGVSMGWFTLATVFLFNSIKKMNEYAYKSKINPKASEQENINAIMEDLE